MNLIIWLIVGGILGWIASKIMHTDAQQGIVLNIISGGNWSLAGRAAARPAIRGGHHQSEQF
jgi:uncharacterized membrane protein YeaQ/YmgE (transglycosylase-associated protein family)